MNRLKHKIEDYVNEWYKASRFQGTIRVSLKSEILLDKGYGFSNIQHRVYNNERTKYNIASYTKQFTAAAVLKLVDQKKIDLNETLFNFVPEYIYSKEITIHQLLSHTSGIPDHTHFDEYSTRERICAELIINRLNKRKLNYIPGEKYEYSNSNYVLLAKIVEVVSSMTIENFLTEYIFKPAELLNTGISKNEKIIEHLATGYSYSGEGIINADYYDMSGAYGSGFIYSNAEDIQKWITALMTGQIISLDSLKKMLYPYHYLWYLDAYVGYGCYVKGENINEMISSGLINGFVYNLWVDLKDEIFIIILSNNDTNALGEMVKGVKKILLNFEPDTLIRPTINESNEGIKNLKNIAGKYLCEFTGGEFNIDIQDNEIYVDQLWIQKYKNKKFKLIFIEETEDKFIFAVEVCDGTFIFNKNSDYIVKDAMYLYDIFRLPYHKIT